MSFYKPYIIDYVTHYHDYILLIYDDLDEKNNRIIRQNVIWQYISINTL